MLKRRLPLDGCHVMVARTDRLGDMVLTAPLFSGIKECFPHAHLSVLASRANCEAARLFPAVDEVQVDPIEARHSGWRGIFTLARKLRALQVEVILLANSKRRLAISAWLARIPVRVGKARHPYSLLYTDRVPSVPGEHESDWALRLLEPFGIKLAWKTPSWPPVSADGDRIEAVLARAQVRPGTPLVVLHPGNSGNALTASPAWYAKVGDALSAAGYLVVLTGTEPERTTVEATAAAMQYRSINLTGELDVGELAALCRRSVACIANSTGPAHIAAAAGTPTIGLYAPDLKQQRWLPRGRAVKIVRPDLDIMCPSCLGPRCQFYNCLDRISPQAVLSALNELAGTPGISAGTEACSHHRDCQGDVEHP